MVTFAYLSARCCCIWHAGSTWWSHTGTAVIVSNTSKPPNCPALGALDIVITWNSRLRDASLRNSRVVSDMP
jgi:hypothetical protein